MPASLSCLHTTVVNTSGEKRIFGFLPPRGRELDVDEEFSEIGTIVDWLQGRGGQVPVAEKQLKALEAAMLGGKLEIKSSPSVVLYDPTAGETKVLTIDTVGVDPQAVVIATPCWLEA